jgi:5,10-methylenetetrahydrofolate reductase
MKIVDKINDSVKDGRTFFSFEYFPPRTEEVCGGVAINVSNIFELIRVTATASAASGTGGCATVHPHHWQHHLRMLAPAVILLIRRAWTTCLSV